ncbi:MAG TPA: DUF4893 domain-containing protein [Allosphingosinicella sp.]|nr:DUF4893 domain-containing protein [Allosphingosinicella sp.]
MKPLLAALLLALPIVAASAAAAQRDEVVSAAPNASWRSVATGDDRGRLRRWRDAWMEALAQVRAGDNAAEIVRGGVLFEPDAALADPAPPAGDYSCRTIKLGTPRRDLLDYVAYPAFRCRIALVGRRLHFTKLTGSQRPVGILFPDNGRRMVFLGTLMLSDETRALRYGRDRERDLVGIVERLAPDRWRIAFPFPHHESLLDVIELTPVARRGAGAGFTETTR